MTTAGCLTVKHVEANGYESVVQAASVAFIPKSQCVENHPNPAAEVIAYAVPIAAGMAFEDGVGRYRNGLVFVMNTGGATVSKYDLDWLNGPNG